VSKLGYGQSAWKGTTALQDFQERQRPKRHLHLRLHPPLHRRPQRQTTNLRRSQTVVLPRGMAQPIPPGQEFFAADAVSRHQPRSHSAVGNSRRPNKPKPEIGHRTAEPLGVERDVLRTIALRRRPGFDEQRRHRSELENVRETANEVEIAFTQRRPSCQSCAEASSGLVFSPICSRSAPASLAPAESSARRKEIAPDQEMQSGSRMSWCQSSYQLKHETRCDIRLAGNP